MQLIQHYSRSSTEIAQEQKPAPFLLVLWSISCLWLLLYIHVLVRKTRVCHVACAGRVHSKCTLSPSSPSVSLSVCPYTTKTIQCDTVVPSSLLSGNWQCVWIQLPTMLMWELITWTIISLDLGTHRCTTDNLPYPFILRLLHFFGPTNHLAYFGNLVRRQVAQIRFRWLHGGRYPHGA